MLMGDDGPLEISFTFTILIGAAMSAAIMGVRPGTAWLALHRGDVVLGGANAARLDVEAAGSTGEGSLGAGLLEPGASPDGGSDQGNHKVSV